jgi:hypothetical protein
VDVPHERFVIWHVTKKEEARVAKWRRACFIAMDKALAYAISGCIVGFGIWILVAGLSSRAPALWSCIALLPIAIGLWSAAGDT